MRRLCQTLAVLALSGLAHADAIGILELIPPEGPVRGGLYTRIKTSPIPAAEQVLVYFGGEAVAARVSEDRTQLNLECPPHAAGVVDIIVAAGPHSGARANAYEYKAGPQILSFGPPTAGVAGGNLVRVDGYGFFDIRITIDGEPHPHYSEFHKSIIEISDLPQRPEGISTVTFTDLTGRSDSFSLPMVKPRLESVTPSSISGSKTAITLKGEGLTPGMFIRIGGHESEDPFRNELSSEGRFYTPDRLLPGIYDIEVVDKLYNVAVLPHALVAGGDAIRGVFPRHGTHAGGSFVRTEPHDFGPAEGVVAVYFDTVPATQVATHVDGNGVSYVGCLSPAHAAGVVDVTTEYANGDRVTVPYCFTFRGGPGSTPPANDANGEPIAIGVNDSISGDSTFAEPYVEGLGECHPAHNLMQYSLPVTAAGMLSLSFCAERMYGVATIRTNMSPNGLASCGEEWCLVGTEAGPGVIDVAVQPGTYLVHIASGNGVGGTFTLDTSFVAATEGEADGGEEGAADGEGVVEGEESGEGEAKRHDADIDASGSIELEELLGVVQLHNAGAFHCANDGKGYAIGNGNTSCRHHDSDYAPADWTVSLSEAIRLVQFYNAGAYKLCAGSEDGYCI